MRPTIASAARTHNATVRRRDVSRGTRGAAVSRACEAPRDGSRVRGVERERPRGSGGSALLALELDRLDRGDVLAELGGLAPREPVGVALLGHRQDVAADEPPRI